MRLYRVLLLALPLQAQSVIPKDSSSELRAAIETWSADRESLRRFYYVSSSPAAAERLQRHDRQWLGSLGKVDFSRLSLDGQIDYLLFTNELRYELRKLDLKVKSVAGIQPLVPFAPVIIGLVEARQEMKPLDPAKAAASLSSLNAEITKARAGLEKALEEKAGLPKKSLANNAAQQVDDLRASLEGWFKFSDGYDPPFTWWCSTPYHEVDASLKAYAGFLREKLAGIKSKEEIVGNTIGREALLAELSHEWIPYTPEELIEIATREYAWCEVEMKKASREMGYGDDWHKALEKVKSDYLEPGKQPALIKSLADEAIAFVDAKDLVTVPPVARETWRMEMMSPERQLINPFFTGGEILSVSYPTQSMTEEQKLMSMRGNNVHFSRATVLHEVIPGHHLQGYMSDRYRAYRNVLSTPFSGEGFALYWEMLFWDLGFAKTPEDRIGMLFWRMHRCARIIFSLSFHLEKMSAQECIDFLVERVGHERENATAEVRRSFATDYTPLYQSAYLLGGLQLRSLRHEMVDSGRMTNRQFHDRILKENQIPIELLRASMTGQKLAPDFVSAWRFY